MERDAGIRLDDSTASALQTADEIGERIRRAAQAAAAIHLAARAGCNVDGAAAERPARRVDD